jgi:anti-sigma regulatory factor (Ser/Thr protein kinase)
MRRKMRLTDPGLNLDLFRNALRYGRTEQITIAAISSDAKVKISFTDNGGFPES